MARSRLGEAIIVATLVAASMGAGCAHRSGETSNRDCRRIALDPKPRWVFFGYWHGDGAELVLPDILGGQLLRYSMPDGSSAGSVSRPGNGPTEFHRPSKIVHGGDEPVLLDSAAHLVGLGHDLLPRWGLDVRSLTLPDSETVTYIRPDLVLGRGYLGVMEILDGSSAAWWGIARLDLEDPPRVERLQQLPAQKTPGGYAYTVLGPFVARAGDDTFALRVDEPPHIQRIGGSEPGKLTAFPAGYEGVTSLSAARGPAGTEGLFLSMEMVTSPIALFGRGDYLYLLTRRPIEDAGTRWIVHQIDPQRDRIVREITLPTRANHVVLVPGPREWAIVEKGRVGPNAEQDIGTLILIASSLVESPHARSAAAGCGADPF